MTPEKRRLPWLGSPCSSFLFPFWTCSLFEFLLKRQLVQDEKQRASVGRTCWVGTWKSAVWMLVVQCVKKDAHGGNWVSLLSPSLEEAWRC